MVYLCPLIFCLNFFERMIEGKKMQSCHIFITPQKCQVLYEIEFEELKGGRKMYAINGTPSHTINKKASFANDIELREFQMDNLVSIAK